MAELGARYPAEAARRLWQLISQDHDLDDVAYTAPAGLLHTLVALDVDVVPLLELLCNQVDRLAAQRINLEFVDRVLRPVQFLLKMVDERTHQSVALDLLVAHPETAELFGLLWAAVLTNRRYRAEALAIIWDGMSVSRQRAAVADALTAALAGVLTGAEQDRFISDFTLTDRRKRQRDRERAASIAQLVIEALARIHGRTSLETK
jgi:hypothetical protein